MAKDCAGCGLRGLRIGVCILAMFATSDPLNPHIRRRIRILCRKWRRTHPSGLRGFMLIPFWGPR
eukprot:5444901-Alexandrium_andersonii.AAC.1